MKKLLLLLPISLFVLQTAFAQLPNGSQAPNFTATDVNGQTYTLYDLLDQGYTVYLDFFATWCGPCWNYHNAHAFENIWQQYGPPGTDEAFCFQIEGDPNTNVNCIFGPSGCNNSTWGDWTDGVSYPTINSSSIANQYQISYYPTIYMVCPADKKVYEVGQLSASGLWNRRDQYCEDPVVGVNVNSVQHVNCFGQSTGAIDITPSGSAPPYSYAWSNGAQSQDLYGIPAGTYTCTVTSSNGVSGTSGPIEVLQPATPLTVQLLETTPVGCNGYSGSITVEASGGGTNDYDYYWSTGQSGSMISVFTPGTFVVTVTDGNGCTKSLGVPMVPPVYPIAGVSTSPALSCQQPQVQLNGTNSSNGPEYVYLWQPSNGGHVVSGAETLTPVVDAAGMYTLFVTNSYNNCTAFASTIVLSTIVYPMADAGPGKELNCATPSDSLEGEASQGSEFWYVWTGPSIISGDSTLHPVVNQSGQYVLKVTNSNNGCTKTDTVAVAVDSIMPVAVIETPEHLNCHNDQVALQTNGSFQGAGFAYNWSGPAGFSSSEENPEVETPGEYWLVIENTDNGCSAQDTAEVLYFSVPAVSIDSMVAIPCYGQSNGALIAVASGGYGDLQFEWNTGDSTNVATGLAAGLYSVTVTDNDACTGTVNHDLVQPELLSLAATATNETGFQTQDGVVNAEASGGVPPFEYQWSNGVSGQNQQNLAAGAYTVTTTDSNGCSNQKTVNVNAYNCTLAVDLQGQNSTCFGANNGMLSATVNGGTGPYTFHWSNGDTAEVVENLAPGWYTLTTTDAAGCPSVVDALITQPSALQVTTTQMEHPVCPDAAEGSVSLTAGGGTTPYWYNWSTGQNTPAIQQLPPGTYSLTITDANNCTNFSQYVITASDSEKPVVTAQNGVIYLDEQGEHVLTLSDVQGMVSDNCGVASWSFFPISKATCLHLGDIPVELNAQDANGNNGSRLLQLTVVDQTPPVAICPDNVEVVACDDSTLVQFPAPFAKDACATFPVEIIQEQISGLPNNSYFPVGVTQQEYRFTDPGGNSANCSFTVSILAPVSISMIGTTPATVGEANGAIQVELQGGKPPYAFVWTRNGEVVGFTQNLENIPAGFYLLEITDANGCVISSTVIEVGSIVAVQEPAWAGRMSIRPNPNTGAGLVDFGGKRSGEARCRITDQLGRLVWEGRYENPEQIRIDLGNAPEGAYYLSIFHENEQVTRMWVVQR